MRLLAITGVFWIGSLGVSAGVIGSRQISNVNPGKTCNSGGDGANDCNEGQTFISFQTGSGPLDYICGCVISSEQNVPMSAIEATGQLPDGSQFQQAVGISVTTTISLEGSITAGFDTGNVGATFGVSVATTTSTTDTIVVNIDCPGSTGQIILYPLVFEIDGFFITSTGADLFEIQYEQPGSIYLPMTGPAGEQLVNAVVVCV
jgi:hypothetical protein